MIPQADTASLRLYELKNNPHLSEKEKIEELGKQFEALLLRQVLRETYKPVIPTMFNQDSTSNSIYRDLMIKRMADEITRSGSLQISESIQSQLLHQAQEARSDEPLAEAETESKQHNP